MPSLRLPDVALAASAVLLSLATVNAISAAHAGYRIADEDRAVFARHFAQLDRQGRMGAIGVTATAAVPGYRVDRACGTFRPRGRPRRVLCLMVLHRGTLPPRIVAPGQAIHP